jgi:hypothetical protein
MTADEIIEEIKRLDLKEQLGVICFASRLAAERRLTGKELSELAEQLVNATDPAEEAIIRQAMIRGFHSVTAGRAGSGKSNKRAVAKRSKNKRSLKRV